jgi:multiple sugar transport system ATP-binding protein
VTHDQVEAMTLGQRVAVMRDGRIQQVDTPQVLYRLPQTLFVAAFIGSPAMNLVDGELVRSDGGIAVKFGGNELKVDDRAFEARPNLKGFEGKAVIIGIRPEDMEDASLVADAPADRRLNASVDLREALGSDVVVHFKVDVPPVVTEDTKELAADLDEAALIAQLDAQNPESEFVARLNAETKAEEGQTIELVVDTRRIHFFDPDTGQGIY